MESPPEVPADRSVEVVRPPSGGDLSLSDLVGTSPLPVVAVVLSSCVVVQLSASAAVLLGGAPRELVGTDLSSMAHEPDCMVDALALLGEGTVDCYESSQTLRRPDGVSVELAFAVHALVSIGHDDRALILVSAEDRAVACAAGRAGEGPVDIGDLLMSLTVEPRPAGPGERIAELEHGLMRISDEIHELGVAAERPAGGGRRLLAEAGLTPRQTEVLQHLLDGQRVPAIARSIFLSQSTVRNHLLAMYRKFDVHSQQELITIFSRRGSDRPVGERQ